MVVLPAMNGVPWWFFHDLGGSHEGAAVRAVDPDGRVATAIPVGHVVGCVVHATCSVVEPGLGRHGFGRGLIIGEPGGGVSARVSALAERLDAAGFETTVSKRIQADVWYKLWGSASR
jgi:2-dehydropantoate 2-reductase